MFCKNTILTHNVSHLRYMPRGNDGFPVTCFHVLHIGLSQAYIMHLSLRINSKNTFQLPEIIRNRVSFRMFRFAMRVLVNITTLMWHL